MKRFLIFMVTMSLILALAGCGKQAQTVELADEPVAEEYIEEEIVEEITETQEPKQQEQTVKQKEYSADTSSGVKNETEAVSKQPTYQNVSNFDIRGKWKNVGTYTFGQVQSGAIVVFDGKNCNVYSPQDTYAFYKDGDSYTLDCTSLLFSETLSFKVKIVDKDNIHIYYGSNYLELKRVE